MRQQVSIKLYQHLGLQEYASKPEIRKAYKSLCLKHHPDRGGDIEKMKQLNAAYDFLMKHKDRYDILLKEYHAKGRIMTIKVESTGGSSNNSTTTGGTWFYATYTDLKNYY